MAKIKEIYIGAVLTKDRDGKEKSLMIYLRGRPVPAGVYTPEELPPGLWTWDRLVESAVRHDGHGIDIIYEGDKKPKESAKAEVDK